MNITLISLDVIKENRDDLLWVEWELWIMGAK